MNWSILKQFSIRNITCFHIRDVKRTFPEMNPLSLTRILAEMVDIGMLCRISRDNYHIIPLNADPETYLPNKHQVAKYLMRDDAYYIGYASALKIHGLRRQLEMREFVITNKQKKPAIRSIGGSMYQFICTDATRFFGFSSVWINQCEKAMVSDLEKTIVDIAMKPQHCGGIEVIGSALYQWNDRLDYDKLFYYFARNMNKSGKKRFLFLTDLLGLEWTSNHERMMAELGSGISILDPTAADKGRDLTRFGLKINVDPKVIRREVLHGQIW